MLRSPSHITPVRLALKRETLLLQVTLAQIRLSKRRVKQFANEASLSMLNDIIFIYKQSFLKTKRTDHTRLIAPNFNRPRSSVISTSGAWLCL